LSLSSVCLVCVKPASQDNKQIVIFPVVTPSTEEHKISSKRY